MTEHDDISPQGRIIEDRITALGITRYQLGKIGPIDETYITHVYKGRKRITKPETIAHLAEILRMPSTDPFYLAIDKVPPDVLQAILRHPQLVTAIRNLAKKLDAQQEGRTDG